MVWRQAKCRVQTGSESAVSVAAVETHVSSFIRLCTGGSWNVVLCCVVLCCVVLCCVDWEMSTKHVEI